MDIDLLRDGEHFSTFDSVNFLDPYPDEMTTLDGIHNFTQNEFEWNEREINGDIALIPVCDMNITFNDSPPNIDDFQKIVNDWQQFINVDPSTELTIDDPIIPPDDLLNSHQKEESIDPIAPTNFDITKYLNDPTDVASSPRVASKKFKAGVKKIDLKAQKYIIDEDDDDVDVETISECEDSSPVLEAGDLKSLLEQFEATQIPELPENFIENVESTTNDSDNIDRTKENVIGNNEVQKFMKRIIKVEPVDEIDIEEHHLVDDCIKYPESQCVKKKEYREKRERKIDKTHVTAIPQSIKDEPPLDSKPKSVIAKSVTPTANKPQDPHNSTLTINNIPNSVSTPPLISSPQKSNPLSNSTVNQSSNDISVPPNSHSPQTNPIVCPTYTKSNSLPINSPNSTPESTTSTTPNKHIIDSLPQELIDRIKESGKRKTISVIPPILPTKKRGGPRMQEAAAQLNKNKMIKLVGMETIQLDHDYCSSGIIEPYPKNPKKDSGFESAEEDDRTMIGKQPTVKTADGKLMVSLLKVNTIHIDKTIQKKKLNFEEYKKRREGFLTSQNNSQSSSPISSSCSSPLPEDEQTKLLKHQEKLMKMAKEVLNTPPKGEKKADPVVVVTPPLPLQVPPDMEMKTLVSIGVNTDFKVRRKNVDPLAPVERLDEIKPLLQKASSKINGNSLITSVIETIPKLIDSCDIKQSKHPSNKDKTEHGEDKTIVYLLKNRASIQTRSVECQTNISLIQQTKASRYRRRRQSSDSSCSSESSRDSRSRCKSRYQRDRSSNNSRCSSRSSKSSSSSKSNSSSSTYSSRSSSRSRSRSASPRHCRKEKERLREVEERRVIYVGRIPPKTTREDLRKRFQRFGAITSVSLHSRDHSYLDNYGFVTFANNLDAYEAIEHGNDDPWQPKFDLSFGGRRIFCQTSYSDLDNVRDECGYFVSRGGAEDSFDKLLRDVQEKLRKRKA